MNHHEITLAFTVPEDAIELLTGKLWHKGEEISVAPNKVYVLKTGG